MPGKRERLPELAQDHGVGAERRDRIHRATHGDPQDDLRTEDRPGEAAPRRARLEPILLCEIEGPVIADRVPLPRGNPHRMTRVGTVGLGALQQRHVFEGCPVEGGESVLEHHGVACRVIRLEPAPDEIGFLEESGVHEVGRITVGGEGGRAGARVLQIAGHPRHRMASVLERVHEATVRCPA